MAFYVRTQNNGKILTKDRSILTKISNEEREKKRLELVKQQVEAEEEAKRLRKEEEKQKNEVLYEIDQIRIEKYLIDCLMNGQTPNRHLGFDQEHWRKYFVSLQARLCKRVAMRSWNRWTSGFLNYEPNYNLDVTSLCKWIEDQCQTLGVTVKVETFNPDLCPRPEITRLGFFQITNGSSVTKWVISDHVLAADISEYYEWKKRQEELEKEFDKEFEKECEEDERKMSIWKNTKK